MCSRIKATKLDLVLAVTLYDWLSNAETISIVYTAQKFVKYKVKLKMHVTNQHIVVLVLVSQHDH